MAPLTYLRNTIGKRFDFPKRERESQNCSEPPALSRHRFPLHHVRHSPQDRVRAGGPGPSLSPFSTLYNKSGGSCNNESGGPALEGLCPNPAHRQVLSYPVFPSLTRLHYSTILFFPTVVFSDFSEVILANKHFI